MSATCLLCRARILSQATRRSRVLHRSYSQGLDTILDLASPDTADTGMNDLLPDRFVPKGAFQPHSKDPRKSFYKGVRPGTTILVPDQLKFEQKIRNDSRPRHPAVMKHVLSRDYIRAWETHMALPREDTADSIDLTSIRFKSDSQLEQLQRDISRAALAQLYNKVGDAERVRIPSLMTMWKDMQKTLPNADDRIIQCASVRAMKHIGVALAGQDVFGTPYRRRHMHELLEFWCAWVGKSKDRDPPAGPYGIIPANAIPNPHGQPRNPILHLYDYIDHVRADFHVSSLFELALCLQYILEHGLAGSTNAAEFEKFKPLVDDLNAIWAASKWTNELRYNMIGRVARHNSPEEKTNRFLNWIESKMGSNEAVEEIVEEDDGSVRYLAKAVNKSVGRYLERQNLRMVERSWMKTQERLNALTPDQMNDPDLGGIYDQFLFAFRSLRRAAWTVSVWNHMIRNGIKPTIKTWNVMLKGCHIGREVDQMEEIWRRMIKSGCQPDEISWGTRIHGLFKFGRVPEAFAALAELSNATKIPSKGRPQLTTIHTVRPDLSILNNALSGAQDLGTETTGRILAWGRGHSIEPDITTYNTLINAALHSGQRQQARKIMSHMSSKSIPPDGATFVILLHALFQDGFLNDLPPAEQETEALSFITSLEADGIPLEERGYALLLDRLLKTHGNTSAATAVLAHMMKREIAPTPHMYTIMMTHYFSQTPPNIPAIEALWRRLQSAQNYVADIILYDRMVEGFARADEYAKMMYFLVRMGKEGKRPGWLALTEALRCIVRKGDRERARELVRDVAVGEGMVNTGVRGRKGYGEFWGLVEELGLMPEGMWS
ncbi:hypothetical protein BDZ85DRAFT_323043 [Elsinoe ampelina]|uniref:Pentatricopeptide repeat protein n=1 Tax=Elsinoe ampelina TaxID=302913 RepID=A0A6A6FYM8_9PEZI|nr:hypothetical protein BDZ85DRAFT_323043 [Elsinoe ampelina]